MIYLLKLSTYLLFMYKRLKMKIIQVALFLFTNFTSICVGIPCNKTGRLAIKHLFTTKANDYY